MKEHCLMAVNVGNDELKEMTGKRLPVKKNYCFMTSHKTGNPTIIEQVRALLTLLNCDLTVSEPYVKTIELTLANALSDFRQSIKEKEICKQELFALRERFGEKKLKLEKLNKDLVLEKDCRTLLETEQRVYLKQRDTARDDNVRLNLLVDKLYNSKETFENIDIVGNT